MLLNKFAEIIRWKNDIVNIGYAILRIQIFLATSITHFVFKYQHALHYISFPCWFSSCTCRLPEQRVQGG